MKKEGTERVLLVKGMAHTIIIAIVACLCR